MSHEVRRATSAYEYYRSSSMPSVQSSNPSASVGELTSLISGRWRSLSDSARAPFQASAAEDRARFERESGEADVRAEREQRERRERLSVVREGESSSSRGGRAAADALRAVQQEKSDKRAAARATRLENEDPSLAEERDRKAAERAEHREAKARADGAVRARHEEIEREEKVNAKKRLEYLLGQSDVFRKLNGGSAGAAGGAPPAAAAGGGPASPTRRSRGAPEAADEQAELEEEAPAVVLGRQPKAIEFGTMKEYQ
ncbi:hypothetical protein TeGR_g9229, partial [Tetraparma gracilis]